MQSPGGITYHQAPGARRARLEPGLEHRAPRDRVGSPRPRNASDASEQDRDGHDQHRVGEDQRQRVGQDVGADDVAVARAQRPRPLDERALLQRQHLRAHDPPRAGPARQPDHEDQHGQRRLEQAREHDHQRQRRDHQEPVLEGVEAAVGPAAEVAADQPDRRAQHRRDERRGEADDDRHARAHQQLREHVRARLGRAQPVLGPTAARARRCSRRAGPRARAARRRRPRNANRPSSADAEQPAPGPEQQPPDLAHADLHPRIEDEVQRVGEQVREDHRDGEDQERPLEHREVLVVDRVVGELAEPGPGEERLDRDHPAGDRAELQRRQRHERQQRVGHRVAAHDLVPRHPRRPLDGHEVLGEDVDHRRAHDHEVLAEQHQRERGRRAGPCARRRPPPARRTSRTPPPASPAGRPGTAASRPRTAGSG